MLASTLGRVSAGLPAALPPPATAATLAALPARALAALGAPVPAGYLTFFRLADGLSWHELVVYGSGGPYLPAAAPTGVVPGFVAANLAWWLAEPATAPRLYLAEDLELLYCYDPHAGAEPYRAYERADWAVSKCFKSAEELLGHALLQHVWAAEKARRGPQ